MKRCIFFVLLIIILSGCNLITKNDESLLPQYKHLKNETIGNFKMLISYQDTTLHYERSEKPLIICYEETGCSRCVLELKQWKTFIKNNKETFEGVDLLVIAYGEKDFYFDYNLKTKKYFCISVITHN